MKTCHVNHPIASVLSVTLLVLLLVGCDTPPTAPTTPAAPAITELDDPIYAEATKDRQEFQMTIPPPGIPAPAPCLGEGAIFYITGTISGWFQVVETPNGHLQVTEHLDFSQLTGSFGGRTWTAQPGSHEIWSISLAPFGDAARVVVHEGRSRFDADDGGGPRMMFVHRIHRLVLPSGELQHNNVTFEANCMGQGA